MIRSPLNVCASCGMCTIKTSDHSLKAGWLCTSRGLNPEIRLQDVYEENPKSMYPASRLAVYRQVPKPCKRADCVRADP